MPKGRGRGRSGASAEISEPQACWGLRATKNGGPVQRSHPRLGMRDRRLYSSRQLIRLSCRSGSGH
eukprot:12889471-Prorocentrum_lima.AAC.1